MPAPQVKDRENALPDAREMKRPTVDDAMESEANAFAMELLIPAEWLMEDVRKMGGVDIEDDASVAALAKRYRVSRSVMTLRLGQLAFCV